METKDWVKLRSAHKTDPLRSAIYRKATPNKFLDVSVKQRPFYQRPLVNPELRVIGFAPRQRHR